MNSKCDILVAMKQRNYIVIPIIAIFVALLGFSTVSADRGASTNRGEDSDNIDVDPRVKVEDSVVSNEDIAIPSHLMGAVDSTQIVLLFLNSEADSQNKKLDFSNGNIPQAAFVIKLNSTDITDSKLNHIQGSLQTQIDGLYDVAVNKADDIGLEATLDGYYQKLSSDVQKNESSVVGVTVERDLNNIKKIIASITSPDDEKDSEPKQKEEPKTQEETDVKPLEGVDVDEPDTVPNGVFWKKVGQKLSLMLTFGEVKDTAKKLEFAEENMLLAEFILENSTDDDDQENAAKLIDAANEYLSEINNKTQNWLDNGPESENAKLVVSNLLTHLDNKVALISNMNILVDLKIDELVGALGEGSDSAAETKPNASDLGVVYGVVPDVFEIEPSVLAILKLDQDGDGLLDTKEIEIGTDLQDSDTDGDGLEDGFEFHHLGTDPLKTDTDGDGYADAAEIKNGFSPWLTDTPLLDGEVLSKIQESYNAFSDDSGINSHITDFKKVYSDIDVGKTDFIETKKLDLELDLDLNIGQQKF